MVEVYKGIKSTEEVEKIEITGLQAVSFAMKAYENLKKAGNPYITTELLSSYMLTIMKMYVPDSIESVAKPIFEEHKRDEKKSNVQKSEK